MPAETNTESATGFIERPTDNDATNNELREVLAALSFFDMGTDEDEGVRYTTQEVWETIYRDRVKDWVDFSDLERARRLLSNTGEAANARLTEQGAFDHE